MSLSLPEAKPRRSGAKRAREGDVDVCDKARDLEEVCSIQVLLRRDMIAFVTFDSSISSNSRGMDTAANA